MKIQKPIFDLDIILKTRPFAERRPEDPSSVS